MKESEIQKSIMDVLLRHPKVAWAYVTSSGYVRGIKGGRAFKVGIPGLPDIIGQLKTGQMLGIEVKKPKEKPTEQQLDFLAMILRNGGVSGWATSVDEALIILGGNHEPDNANVTQR